MEPFVREALGTLTRPGGRVDRDKGVIYGVRLVNPESGNGRYYPPAVLARAAAVYEGAAVYWGHRKRHDDTFDPTPKFGRIANVRPAAGGGLEADLQFNPAHQHADAFVWACENNPSLYSLSQHARINWQPQPDARRRKVAADVLEVASVDIVSEGGTTSSVFESISDIGNNLPAMNPKDPQTVAALVAGLPDPTAVGDFLTALFDALPSGVFGPSVKMDMLAAFMDKLDGQTTPESLRRRGAVGKWAADQIDGYMVKEAKAAAAAKARDLIAEAKLPDAAVTDVFVGLVTESLGRGDDAARRLIADRRAVLGTGPRTSTPGDGRPADVRARAAAFDPN